MRKQLTNSAEGRSILDRGRDDSSILVPFEDPQLAATNFHSVCINAVIAAITNGAPYFRAFRRALELSEKPAQAKAAEKQFRSILHNAEALLATVTAIAAERQYGR